MNEASPSPRSGRTGLDAGAPLRHAVRPTSAGDVAYCGAGRIVHDLGEDFNVNAADACPSCVAQVLLDGMGSH